MEKKNSKTGDTNTRKGHMGQQVLYIVGALELRIHGSKNGIGIAMKTAVSWLNLGAFIID